MNVVATGAAIALRPMTVDDLGEVVALERLVGGRGWSRRTFEVELADPATRRYLVAETDGRVVGFAGVRVVVDVAEVTNIVVAPDLRRRGVATRLLARLLDDAAGIGASDATLEVRPSNAAARALYRQLGFRDEGRRQRYYADGEDAVIMWRRTDEGRG